MFIAVLEPKIQNLEGIQYFYQYSSPKLPFLYITWPDAAQNFTVMAGLIHAHINTYVYTIVASAGAFSEASIHTHTYAHNDVSCLLCELLYVRIYTRAVLCMFMFMLLH